MRAAFWAILLVLGIGSSNDLASSPPLPESFDECAALVRDAPNEQASYFCYAYLARHTGALPEATRRLEAYLAYDPDNALALYALASVEAWRNRERCLELFDRSARAYASGTVARHSTPVARR